MATGFICWAFGLSRVRRPLRLVRRDCIAGLLLMAACAAAGATQVGLAGIFAGKAILLIDGRTTRTVGVGQTTPEGVKLLAIENGAATVLVDGNRQALRLGENASGNAGATQTIVLDADSRGHYVTTGSVNGIPVRFLVDTGASVVAIGAGDAKRLGLNMAGAERGFAQTANGVAPIRRVRLDNVRVGSISIDGVDAAVQESDMPMALLGMSFLNRMDMQNEGGRMTLKKRY